MSPSRRDVECNLHGRILIVTARGRGPSILLCCGGTNEGSIGDRTNGVDNGEIMGDCIRYAPSGSLVLLSVSLSLESLELELELESLSSLSDNSNSLDSSASFDG